MLLGIDTGTSATKAVLCDTSGAVIATASAPHDLSHPHPGWSEQDPEMWWRAARDAIAGALRAAGRTGRDIAAIGLSGQMHGSVFLDAETIQGGGRLGRALRPALLWNDQRTAAQCAAIEAAVGGRRRLVELAGNAALTGFTLPKILWLRDHEPALFARTRAVLLPKDYIRFRLTGDLATDAGDASGTLLMDIDRRGWSPDLFAAVNLDPALLPPILESAQVAGRVSEWAAAETGLAPGTPVVAGSGDNQAGAIGAGVVRAGMVLATVGTSGVIYAHADCPRKDIAEGAAGRVHTMAAATGRGPDAPGQWCITGCMLSAGGSLRWCRDTLFPGDSYDDLLVEASAAPPGSGGLVFLPYLTGERCPYPDPTARGGWVGLTARHGRPHLVRSVVEGVSFGLGQILDLVRAMGVEATGVRLGGGGARSPFWRQMLADVFDCPCATTNTEEGPAFGAALLAGVGAGEWASVAEACDAAIRESEVVEPASAPAYRAAREVYARLYEGLRPHFISLAHAEAASR